jgi:hypothetical protein
MVKFKALSFGFAFSAMYLALIAATPADAQTASSSSNSTSAAGAASQSGSGAAAIINQNSTTPANTTNTTTFNSNERVSGGTNSSINQSGYTTSDVTVRTTPTVYAPPVSGGNPCTLAVSGGVSVIGWGAAAGGTFVDEDCANRQKIAMVHNAGYQGVAFELMCNDRATYNAVKSSASPRQCAYREQFEGGRPALLPSNRPVAVPEPVPTPLPVATTKVYPRCDPRRGINDNCQS